MSGSLVPLAMWVLILASWEAAFRLFHWPEHLFPAPSTLWRAMVKMLEYLPAFGERPLLAAPLVSLLRLAAGFALSIVVGGLLGLAMWTWRPVDRFLGPLFLGLQTLPSVCWVPLAILVLSNSEQGILFVVVMGSAFAIAIALRDGLRTIPPVYRRAGLMLGAQGWRLYRYVLLPASLPAAIGSLRQGFSFAWRSLMGAELLFAVQQHGLGFLLAMGRSFGDVAQVVLVMIIMIVIGMSADRWVFAPLQSRVQARFGLN